MKILPDFATISWRSHEKEVEARFILPFSFRTAKSSFFKCIS